MAEFYIANTHKYRGSLNASHAARPRHSHQADGDIRGDLVEDVFNAVRGAGHRLSLDATEPRLLPTGTGNTSANEMAIRLSHVPPRVRFGV